MAFASAGHDSHQGAISAYLASKGISPATSWLTSLTSSTRPAVPLQSLQQTAYFQILASDITTSVQPTTSFPQQLSDRNIVEQRYAGPILVQLLDIEDIGASVWSQIEAIDAQERGDAMRGREVVRVLPAEQTSDTVAQSTRSWHGGPYKLCIQDARGTKLDALILDAIANFTADTPIGSKLQLRDLRIARGVILLDARNVQFLGGKVVEWDNAWKATRKHRLTEKIRLT